MKFILIGLAILILILIIVYLIKRKRAIKKVRNTCIAEKLVYVNNLLKVFGFEFDLQDGIVISRNDAWQRDLGYTDFYDVKSPFLNMVLNAEPIFFDYDCKHYRLEVWKGQYGITTGAEIGLYIQDNTINSKFYRSARDDEKLKMGFILYKNCYLFSRCGVSWWLTGFDVGRFSKPNDLTMKVSIELKDSKMRDSFVQGLINAGYSYSKIEICDNVVMFSFCDSMNYKLNKRWKVAKLIVQLFNWLNCSLYMFFTRMFNRSIDKIAYVMYMFPHLYKILIRIYIPRRKNKSKLILK